MKKFLSTLLVSLVLIIQAQSVFASSEQEAKIQKQITRTLLSFDMKTSLLFKKANAITLVDKLEKNIETRIASANIKCPNLDISKFSSISASNDCIQEMTYMLLKSSLNLYRAAFDLNSVEYVKLLRSPNEIEDCYENGNGKDCEYVTAEVVRPMGQIEQYQSEGNTCSVYNFDGSYWDDEHTGLFVDTPTDTTSRKDNTFVEYSAQCLKVDAGKGCSEYSKIYFTPKSFYPNLDIQAEKNRSKYFTELNLTTIGNPLLVSLPNAGFGATLEIVRSKTTAKKFMLVCRNIGG